MKKYFLMTVLLLTYALPNDVSPVISIRYDMDSDIVVTDAIGLQFNLGENRYTGFDTDGTDHRLYVGWSFGKIGFGHDGENAEYTIGATKDIVDNIGLELDYVMGDNSNNLRLGINIKF